MGNIVLLDELTINKIAAGEVIERPASVIKEMVENSIDAGATNINIEIRNGGISYIRIADNGCGIAKDDLEIAFERHATSKIRSANDLDSIKSMGFRGEALASIAAIANVEMISRTENDTVGNKIIVEAGNVLLQEETGCQVGTTITVQNLFFNTPVRYKFLKKDYTESGYIEDIVTRLALIHPEIAFKLINTGKTIIQTSGNGNLQDVIYSIFGKDIASAILDVDYTYEDIHITGVVGKPEIARSNRSNQLFFVNKRYIKDKTLASGAENAFKGLLPIGKYGFLVLNVDINPNTVDVNVHPAKLEVRFQEENKVFKAVYHAIKDTLLKSELIENVQKDPVEDNSNNVETQSRPSISELFRKISKTPVKDTKTEDSNNLIEDIYKNNEKNNKAFSKEYDQNEDYYNSEYNLEKGTEKVEDDKDEKSTNVDKKTDLFKELIAMQQRLKEEAENDPTLHTNIDQLIKDTQNITNINKPEENVVDENNKQIINEEENNVLDNNVITSEEIEQPTKLQENEVMEQEEKSELKEFDLTYLNGNKENTNLNENNENYEVLPDSNKNEDLQDNLTQETKSFTSEEIQEMIEKLDNVENVEQSPEFASMYEKIFGKLPASVEEEKREQEKKISAYELIKDNNVSVFETTEEFKKPVYKLVGIAFNTYIIIEIEKELYIIDQHAAHERIMYEKVKENYYSDSNKDSQMLLLPDVITLTHKEMDILRDNIDMFEKAGFELEEFGENTIKLTGVPNICIDLNTKELFLETLDEINTVARTAKQEIEERFIATVACKAAVKANMNLTTEEVDNLMQELLKLPNPFTCPHGRPTAIKMDKNDIEKKFARRK